MSFSVISKSTLVVISLILVQATLSNKSCLHKDCDLKVPSSPINEHAKKQFLAELENVKSQECDFTEHQILSYIEASLPEKSSLKDGKDVFTIITQKCFNESTLEKAFSKIKKRLENPQEFYEM